jgi:hypothetical protein
MHCVKIFNTAVSHSHFAARDFLALILALFSGLVTLFFASAALAATIQVIHPGPETALDTRSQYDWIVLRTALEKTRGSGGNFDLIERSELLNSARQLLEMSNPSGRINIFAKITTIELEKKFLPIRIPFDLGIRGYRVFLIRANSAARFAEVKNIADLSTLSFGQGDAWTDVDVLQSAGLKVVKSGLYSSLFPMLSKGRFDAFPRAIDEAYAEIDERQFALPDLMVEQGLLLYYPMPRYYFVRRDHEGELLAKRIESGLETMIADGSLRTLFEKHKGELINRSKLKSRRLLSLPNPLLPPETPLKRRELWYAPFAGK